MLRMRNAVSYRSQSEMTNSGDERKATSGKNLQRLIQSQNVSLRPSSGVDQSREKSYTQTRNSLGMNRIEL
jgi:hypothetical protein